VIVVDASVVVNALTDEGPLGSRAWLLVGKDSVWFSASHLEGEVMSAIRGRHLGGGLSEARATAAIAGLASLRLSQMNVAALLPRIWELRNNLTAYDAAYVAAAETLGCPLVTADARLAAAPGLRCEVRLAA
jgi:predicted nucleic acid-binding protein